MQQVKRIALAIVLAVLVGFAVPIYAQDATDVVLVTNTPGPGVDVIATTVPEVVVEATPVVEVPDETIEVPISSFWNMQNVMLLTFVIGGVMGALATGGPLLLVIGRIDKSTKDNAERLFQSTPPSVQETTHRIVGMGETAVETMAALVKLLKEVTDGQPNSETAKTAKVDLTAGGIGAYFPPDLSQG
jgi:uncharacterized ion transporter superfamily protein YfcC